MNVYGIAKFRWFEKKEVVDILTNYAKYGLNLMGSAPQNPEAGSFFLYDKSRVKHFRKDGHCWQKKKDGKSVKETHEKLKYEGEFRLQCCYVRHEEIPNFHRRVYELLNNDKPIVLVHYLIYSGKEIATSDNHTQQQQQAAKRKSLNVVVEGSYNQVQLAPLENFVQLEYDGLVMKNSAWEIGGGGGNSSENSNLDAASCNVWCDSSAAVDLFARYENKLQSLEENQFFSGTGVRQLKRKAPDALPYCVEQNQANQPQQFFIDGYSQQPQQLSLDSSIFSHLDSPQETTAFHFSLDMTDAD